MSETDKDESQAVETVELPQPVPIKITDVPPQMKSSLFGGYTFAQYINMRIVIPATMSFFVLCLCAYKIIVVTDPQELRAVYWAQIATILGSWMPSPGSRALDDGGQKPQP